MIICALRFIANDYLFCIYFRDYDADIGGRSVHRIEITRPYVRENDSGVRQDHQSEEGRCGQLGQWTVQLIRRESYLLIYCF